MQANPCLLEPWPKVFSRLSQQGWMRAEHQCNSTSGSQTMFYFFSGTAAYRAGSAEAGSKTVVAPSSVEEARAQGIVPGQLLFTSRAAMMSYIARYEQNCLTHCLICFHCLYFSSFSSFSTFLSQIPLPVAVTGRVLRDSEAPELAHRHRQQ